MDGSYNILKEVVPHELQSESQWKEFCFDTGATPSTLQDIKVLSHSGGYCFQTDINSFIYWRSNYDILELVEQNLDLNLTNNHVRYKFQGAPILDGITVHKCKDVIILLVPTVCSVHKLIFTRPLSNKSSKTRPSIFTDASIRNVSNPIMYHLFNTSPHLPYTATSALATNKDAIFAMPLSNGVILVVKLQNLTGVVEIHYLKHDTGISGLLSGLKDKLSGSRSIDEMGYSLEMEQFEHDMFLFVLNRYGQLRVWSISKLQCISIHHVLGSVTSHEIGIQSHVLRKCKSENGLILACFMSLSENSQIVICKCIVSKDNVNFGRLQKYGTPLGQDLVEMVFDDDKKVLWCLWRSQESGSTTASGLDITTGGWIDCVNEIPQSMIEPPRQGVTPREHYLSIIFAANAFSMTDIAKVLTLYRRTLDIEAITTKADLRIRVCAAVESEIQNEVQNFEISDEDYIDLQDRCWSKFYMNCLQYQSAGKVPNGMLWIRWSSMLMVITKTNVIFYRPCDSIEKMLYNNSDVKKDDGYRALLSALDEIQLNEEHAYKLQSAIQQNVPLEGIFSDVALEIQKCIGSVPDFQQLRTGIKSLIKLVEVEELSDDDVSPGNTSRGALKRVFRSTLGTSIMVETIRQITSVRLVISTKIGLLLNIMRNEELCRKLLLRIYDVIYTYGIFDWTCKRIVKEDANLPSVMNAIVLSSDKIHPAHSSIIRSVNHFYRFICPLKQTKRIPEYLYNLKYHEILHQYSKMVDHHSWIAELIQSYLEIGQPIIAYDLVTTVDGNLDSYLEVFNKGKFLNVAIDLANFMLGKPEHEDVQSQSVLYSVIFNHHITLGHFEEAYKNMIKNPDATRRSNCLRVLVPAMIDGNARETLLSFTFDTMKKEVQNLIETRARALHVTDAIAYYETLYAYYTRRKNFRKAAHISFEVAFRSEENDIQKQWYCLSLNCLSLVRSEYAWILIPNKLCENSDESLSNDKSSSLSVYGKSEIKIAYELASARCLLDCPHDVKPGELIKELTITKQFKMAFVIASLVKAPKDDILEALTITCLSAQNDEESKSWLTMYYESEKGPSNLPISTIAENVLEQFLNKYEEGTTLHKVVANRIMASNEILPFWLRSSYEAKNPTELLKLYLKYGEAAEALSIAKRFLTPQYLQHIEKSENSPPDMMREPIPLPLPLKAIDILYLELDNKQSQEYHRQLKDKLEKYINIVKRTSQNQFGMQRVQVGNY